MLVRGNRNCRRIWRTCYGHRLARGYFYVTEGAFGEEHGCGFGQITRFLLNGKREVIQLQTCGGPFHRISYVRAGRETVLFREDREELGCRRYG